MQPLSDPALAVLTYSQIHGGSGSDLTVWAKDLEAKAIEKQD